MKSLNKLTGSFLALSLTASIALAGEAAPDTAKVVKELEQKIEDQGIYVETAQKGIILSGYVDAGYMYNFIGPESTVPTKNVPEQDPMGDFSVFDTRISLEKKLSDKVEYSAGFRIDLNFGEDNGGTSALRVHQAYATFRVPVGNGLDFKVGKFATIVGYEVSERLVNANITHGLLYVNLEPLTHVGVLASYKFSDILSAELGIGNGWNNDDGLTTVSFNDEGGSHNFDPYVVMASFTVTAPGGNAMIKNAATYSWNGETGAGYSAPDTVFLWNQWGTWTPKFANDKLTLGYSVDLGFASVSADDFSRNKGPFGGDGGKSEKTTWLGVAAYAKYQFTKIFSLASRGEYMASPDGFSPYGTQAFGDANLPWQDNSGSYDRWSYTLTAGFDIWENLTTRIEYRVDWGNETVFGGGGSDSHNSGPAHMAAVEVGYTF